MAQEQDQKHQRSTTTEVRAQDRPSRESSHQGLESSRRESGLRSWSDPFDALRQFTDRLDRFAPFWGPPAETAACRRGLAGTWTPQIESFQRGDQFVVRADLPGLTKNDVHVELAAGRRHCRQRQASFENGVLEVTLQAPPHETRHGRRVEITDGDRK